MASISTKLPYRSFKRLFTFASKPTICRSFSTTETQTQTQKLERIADELLDLNKFERRDFRILMNYKMGLHRLGVPGSGASLPGSAASGSGSGDASPAAAAAVEKTTFDIKLEKFDAAAKIKIIKEVRTFTDLGLKEAKDLVEKVPVVLKKQVTKEEADSIVEKLKELGATVVLE